MVANIGVCLCNFWILNQKWQQTSKTTLFSSMELRGKGLIFKIVQQNNVSVTSVSVYYFVLFSPFCPLFFPFAVNKTSQGQKNPQCCPETQHCFEEQVVDLNPPSQTRRPWQSKPNTVPMNMAKLYPLYTNQFCRFN